jgi:biopolymer transport protein ExbD
MSDHKKLDDRLREVFKERGNNGVFREGTNEVEKTVYLKVPKSAKYGDFIKLVEVVKGSGAEPIGIQIDDVSGRTIDSIK